jgi:hypothetical protein
MHRTSIPRKKVGEALAAWLKDKVGGNVYARIRIAGAGDIHLALELARMLASAGHTVSVGNICRFRPAKSINQEESGNSHELAED